MLVGCAGTPPPQVIDTCPQRLALLQTCRRPDPLPADPADFVLAIWSALTECETAVRVLTDQPPAR